MLLSLKYVGFILERLLTNTCFWQRFCLLSEHSAVKYTCPFTLFWKGISMAILIWEPILMTATGLRYKNNSLLCSFLTIITVRPGTKEALNQDQVSFSIVSNIWFIHFLSSTTQNEYWQLSGVELLIKFQFFYLHFLFFLHLKVKEWRLKLKIKEY